MSRRKSTKDETHIRDVHPGQEDLSDRLIQLTEQLIPERDKLALPYSRQGLLPT